MKLYRLENRDVKIDISPIGASVVNFFVQDNTGVERNIVLGYDNEDQYKNNGTYFGAVVGPIANRIENGEFKIDGHKYSLTQNDGTNSLHGGDAELNSKIWDIQDFTDKTVLMTCNVKNREGGYPCNISISVAYFLTETNDLIINYSATPMKRCPLNITQHMYFNLDESEDILDHEVWIDSSLILPVDENLIPDGTQDVRNTPFDFREPRFIREAMSMRPVHRQIEIVNGGYDHCFVLNSPRIEKNAMRIRGKKSGINLIVRTDLPAVQFYTGNSIDNERGRNGDIYLKHAGFCLETQYYPNQINMGNNESCVFNVEKPFLSTTVYSVTIE